ncbi:MAG: carboxymuconolactone decarboxylase family protein [Mycobacteriales bacterium]
MTTQMSTIETYRAVMAAEPPQVDTPFEAARRDFLFGQVWNRPGLSIRDRRIVSLACVSAADAVKPIEDHIYGVLASGDLTIEELNEITLHFAVYCGWPKASQLEVTVRMQWYRLHAERGEEPPPFPSLGVEDLGPEPREERLRIGRESYEEVNLSPPPPSDSAYFHAGIVGFVFGHVWRRPALSRRDRRLVTLPCVALSDTATPIASHVGSALGSGDISWDEMQEIILQFSAYYGFAKGEALHDAAQRWQADQP